MTDMNLAMNRGRDWLRRACRWTDHMRFLEPDTAIRAAQQLMRAQTTQPGSSNNLYRRVTWDIGDRVVGELHEEPFSDCARDAYVACAHWEETFAKNVTDDETAETRTQHDRADGWILIGGGLCTASSS